MLAARLLVLSIAVSVGAGGICIGLAHFANMVERDLIKQGWRWESWDTRMERERYERDKQKYARYIAPREDPELTEARKNSPSSSILHLIRYTDELYWYTMDLAAAQGRLNLIKSDHYLLQDAHEQNRTKQEELYRFGMQVGYSWRALVAAARFGHLDVLKWFSPDMVQYHSKKILEAADEGLHQEVKDYVRSLGPSPRKNL